MQEKNTLVSIVMPSYNSKRYIEATIRSVQNQSYGDWELIIVDDCSNDGTQAFISELIQNDSRIRLIELEKNNGAPAAPRNIGVRAAKGFWIALLDSDDIWHPKKLELQINAMKDHKARFSSTSSLNFIDETLIKTEEGFTNVPVEKITFNMQRIKGRIANSSVVVEKELLLKYPFNEDPRYKAVEDYHCWLRIHEDIEKSIKLKAPLLFYRIIEGQISGSKLKMLKKVFLVHKVYSGSLLKALFFTMTHAAGAIYFKFISKGI